jgi:hypothetical protein
MQSDRGRTSTQKAESLVARLVGLSDPSAAAKICEALASCLEESAPGTVDDTLALEAGRLASVRHPNLPDVLLSVGRLYLAAGLLERAYRSLADALQAGASGARPYRLIGETLLRLGDAQLAMPMLKRAMLERCDDPDTPSWYACAKAYVPMQEAEGSDAVARDVHRRRGQEPTAAPATQSTKQKPDAPLPRFPSLLDCSEISGMATRRMARKPPATPPPLPPEPRTRTDAPCTLSLDEPLIAPLSELPVIAEDSSVDHIETVVKQQSTRPPPLPTPAKSVKPPPLPKVPTAAATAAAAATTPAPAPAAPPAPPSAPASAPALATPAESLPAAATVPTTGAASAPAPVSTPGAKVRVDQSLWESDVTPRNLPQPAAPPAARRARQLKWLQAAALLLAGAISGFAIGSLHGQRSGPLDHAGAAPTESAIVAAINPPPAEAPPSTTAESSAARAPASTAAADAPAAVAPGSAAPSATASAALRPPSWPPIDPLGPSARLYSTAEVAVVAGAVPVGFAVSPLIAAGKRALGTAPRRPVGRVWP